MNIVVYGAGAIGSLFGAFLSKENDVTLVGREEHILAVREKGLRIIGLTHMNVEPKTATSEAGTSSTEQELTRILLKRSNSKRKRSGSSCPPPEPPCYRRAPNASIPPWTIRSWHVGMGSFYVRWLKLRVRWMIASI